MYSNRTHPLATKRTLLNNNMMPNKIRKEASGAIEVCRNKKVLNLAYMELVAVTVCIGNRNTQRGRYVHFYQYQ